MVNNKFTDVPYFEKSNQVDVLLNFLPRVLYDQKYNVFGLSVYTPYCISLLTSNGYVTSFCLSLQTNKNPSKANMQAHILLWLDINKWDDLWGEFKTLMVQYGFTHIINLSRMGGIYTNNITDWMYNILPPSN
jgi:hypothetical protein